MGRRNWSELQGRVVRSRFTLGQSAVYTPPGGAAVDITVIIGRQPIVNENGVPETLKTCAFNTLEINPVRGALIVIDGEQFYVTDPIVGEIDPDFMQRRYIVVMAIFVLQALAIHGWL